MNSVGSSNGLSKKDLESFFSFGSEIICSTRELILELWRNGEFSTELKADTSPVTQVDLRAEELVRESIKRRFPSHGIIGEEFESTNLDSDFHWVIDPIDGTQNLINRIPTFGTLLGLRFRGEAVLGFIDHPVLGVCIQGGKGLGVSLNGKSIILDDLSGDKFSPTDLIATSSLHIFQRGGVEKPFYDVLKLHPHTRIYYDCYAHTLTVSGSLSACLETDLNVWDVTPFEALVGEAGGACHYFGAHPKDGQIKNINAVFGKKKAVSILKSYLQESFG